MAEAEAVRNDLVERRHRYLLLCSFGHGEELGVLDQSAQFADSEADKLRVELLLLLVVPVHDELVAEETLVSVAVFHLLGRSLDWQAFT